MLRQSCCGAVGRAEELLSEELRAKELNPKNWRPEERWAEDFRVKTMRRRPAQMKQDESGCFVLMNSKACISREWRAGMPSGRRFTVREGWMGLYRFLSLGGKQ